MKKSTQVIDNQAKADQTGNDLRVFGCDNPRQRVTTKGHRVSSSVTTAHNLTQLKRNHHIAICTVFHNARQVIADNLAEDGAHKGWMFEGLEVAIDEMVNYLAADNPDFNETYFRFGCE